MGVLDRYRKDEKKKPSVLDRYKEQPQYGYSRGPDIKEKVISEDAKKANRLRSSTITDPINTDLKVAAERLPQQEPFVNSFRQSANRLVDENKKVVRLAGKEFPVTDLSNDPSRDIPVIGDVLQLLDKVKKATLPVAQVGGAVYTPGGGLANVAALTGNVGSKVAQYAPQITNTLKGRILNEAIKEGVTGVPLAAGQALAQGQDMKDVALQGAIGGVGGAVIGGALPLVGAGASKILSKYRGAKEVQSVTSPTLALPEPRQRGNVNQVATEDIIYARETGPRGLPEPTSNTATYEKGIVNNKPNISKEDFQKMADSEEYFIRTVRTPEKDMSGRKSTPAGKTGIELGLTQDTHNGLSGFKLKDQKRMLEWMGKEGWEHENVAVYRGKRTDDQVVLDKDETEFNPSELVGYVPTKLFKESGGDFHKALTSPTKPKINLTDSPLKKEVVGFNRPRKDITQEVDEILPSQSKSVLDRYKEPVDDIIKTKEPRVRDKIVSFLDEQEKAARERIAKSRNVGIVAGESNIINDYAIIGAAKLGKQTVKFADWSEAMIKDFGEEIRPQLRNIYNRSRSLVQDTERRATKEAQDARTFNATDSGDASTFRTKVSRDTKASKIPFAQRFEKIRTQLVDDLAPLEGLEKRVRGKLSSAEDSLYKAGRLFRGVPEKANRIVKDRLAPIINDIEFKGYTSFDLGDYALAVHAKDVNARDIKSGFTNKEIDEVINRLGTPEMEVARKSIIKISNDMLTELEKQGVISGDLVTALKERYPNYMPLFRNFDDESVNFSDGLSKALANVTSPIKGLKGSERQVIDPMESMVKNIFQSTNAAERNKVASQLAKLSKDDIDGSFIRELAEGEEVGRKNVVSVLVGGNKVRYEVEPEVYKAMLNLDKESSNTLIKILQKPASLLRAGATLTPEFSLRNPLRDVVQAFVVSESGFNPLIDFPVGLIQSISKGNLYKDWVKELGAYGNIISNDRDVHKEALERVLKESPGKKFVNVVNGKSLIKVLRAISDTTESATKVGEFRAALRKGTSKEEAAYRSRDIMDFGRAGTSIRETNKIVAFLNANIQGKSKLIRAFKKNPAGFTARAFTSITVPTMGVFMMQKYMANDAQKQTIDESPTWMTDTFWLVPVLGTDQVARIPKPFDIGTLFANLPERALKYTFNNDKEAFDGFAKKAMADGTLPGMITGLLPIVEGMANYSFFRGSRIIPQGEEGREYKDQYDINTTETAKFLAKGVQKVTGGEGSLKNFSSPRVMDNTIKGLTAGLGTYATSAIDVMLDKFNITDNPVKPEKAPAQKPLAKAFLVNPLQGGKSTEKIYDLKEKLTKEKGSAKLNNTPFTQQPKLKFVTDQTGKMSDITKEIRKIENSALLSASEKRKRIEPLISRRNEIARDTIKRIDAKESTTK